MLELGAGTALPGLLCAKVGAKKVFLSDEAEQANTLKNISEAVNLNSLQEQVSFLDLRIASLNLASVSTQPPETKFSKSPSM